MYSLCVHISYSFIHNKNTNCYINYYNYNLIVSMSTCDILYLLSLSTDDNDKR